MFKGDSADMCAGKFPLVSMGGGANGQACADGERGPPSAQAEISIELQVPEEASEPQQSQLLILFWQNNCFCEIA